MRVADFVRISAETLKMLSKHGIRTEDFKYTGLFADYERMAGGGDKISYIVAVLAERYAVSESSVWRILRRFKATV